MCLGIGVVGVFVAVFGAVLPTWAAHLVPWGYYSLVTPVDFVGTELVYFDIPYLSVLALAVVGSGLFLIATGRFDRQEGWAMGSVYTEFLKLKRSMSWAVVLLLPIIMVSTGSMSSIAGGGQFDDGWHTLWIRSIGFYGMAILSVGIAILASLVWRVEHRGSN